MSIAYVERITDGLRAFDATAGPVVFTLLPFAQTPNKEIRVQKVDVGPNTVSIQTDPATSDTFANGETIIVLTDNTTNYFTQIRKPGVSGIPALVLSGVGATGSGPLTPPPVSSLAEPIITIDPAGNAVMLFNITYPANLGSMTAIYVQLQMPYVAPSADTSSGVPASGTPLLLGPFALNIVDGAVTNTQAYITVPAPSDTETWSAEVATANPSITNAFLGSGPGFVTFEVGPGPGPAGAEWAPNPLGPLGLTVDRQVRTGAEEWWRPTLTWENPTTDPGYPNVSLWDIGLLDPLIVSTDPEQQIISLGTVTYDKASFQSQYIRVSDAIVAYVLMVRPINSSGDQNSYVPGVTTAINCPIGPAGEIPGEEVADIVTGLAAVPRWGKDSTGARVLFIDCSWSTPDDPRFGGVTLYIGADGSTLPGTAMTGLQPASPFSPWLNQSAINPGNYWITAISMDANSDANTYLLGTTPSVEIAIVAYTDPTNGAPTDEVTGFSVSLGGTSGYSTDNDGKLELILIPAFTPPAADPTWGWIEWWWTNQAGAWQVLGDPSTPGVQGQATLSFVPTASFTPTFLAVTKDVNGKDNDGNATTDPTAPPAGTPSYNGLTINPPGVGTAGQEYCAVVTITSIVVAVGPAAGDGTFQNLVTVTIVPPSDKRWGSYDVVYEDAAGDFVTWAHSVRSSVDKFLWKSPAGAVAGTWYVVSRDVTGRANSIVGGITPDVTGTYGSTSQLDFSAVKLSSISEQFGVVGGVYTAIQISSTILTDQLQIGGGTLNGTCSTSGTAVTGLTGSSFVSGMAGMTIYIDGGSYIIATFNTSTSLTLKTAAPTLTGVNWSFGMPPQFKIFDRSNTEIGFWGDDSFNTGFVGLFAGRDVRLGGTISSPIFEVDSGGAVTITGATFAVVNGFVTVNIDATNFVRVINSSVNQYSQMLFSEVQVARPGSGDFTSLTPLGVNNTGPSLNFSLTTSGFVSIGSGSGYTGTLAAAISAGKSVLGGIILN